jgi:hypothetical protein
MGAACQRATTSRDPISIRSPDPSPAHKITIYGWSIGAVRAAEARSDVSSQIHHHWLTSNLVGPGQQAAHD